MSSHSDLVAQFCALTGAPATAANAALEAANWNLNEATTLYLDQQEGVSDDGLEQPEADSSTAPAPTPAAPSSSSRQPPQNNSRLRTLRDLQSSAQDDDDDDERDPDMFAGGEKSGLAVQNPGSGGRGTDHFRNIMNQARQNRDRPPPMEEEEPVASGNFAGRAQTLGGDEAPSRVIDDPQANSARSARPERVNRTLHLWRDGVSVDDGPLFRFDDPANEHIMRQINQGHAPASLLEVLPNQEVDLALEPHKDEDYVQPKKKYKPFSGQGQRLGSPVPGIETATTTTSAAPVTSQPAASNSTDAVTVDESSPIVSLQIRLGDGTRLTSRFNTTHTVGDIHTFVDRAQANQRAYVLMTTFPSKELSDKSQTLGDLPDFKRGGVVVQKWT